MKKLFLAFALISVADCILLGKSGLNTAAVVIGILGAVCALICLGIPSTESKKETPIIPIQQFYPAIKKTEKEELKELIMMNPEQPANKFVKKHENDLYIRFFHGRDTVDEQPDGWGFEGPIVGAIGIQWTYGGIRLFNHADGDDANLKLNKDGDLVEIDGKFYGDWCVLSGKEEAEDVAKKFDTVVIDLAEYKRQTNQK